MLNNKSWFVLLLFLLVCDLPAYMGTETPTGPSVPLRANRRLSGTNKVARIETSLNKAGNRFYDRTDNLIVGRKISRNKSARFDQAQGRQHIDPRVGQGDQQLSESGSGIQKVWVVP